MRRRILFVLGTRPEAIKLLPVLHCLRGRSAFEVSLCVTAQHRAMLDQVLSIFNARPDYDLDLMREGQTPAQVTARILERLESVLAGERPDMVLVQGDTTTTLAGALAAFYARIPVGHVEAGLRTGDLGQPFPEEMNRVVTSRLAALHFAPTRLAADQLLREGVDAARVIVTGNPGIDAVFYACDTVERGAAVCSWPELDTSKKVLLVTAHRRESFGSGFQEICRGLARLAGRSDVQIVFPVHRNPQVREPVYRMLGKVANVSLIEPLGYLEFVGLMRRAYLLLTDSGGIQEEAPSLGKPVLVLRDKTERPEAVEAGTVRLVGASAERIVGESVRLLEDGCEYARMSRIHNPYGDGRASERIAEAMESYFSSLP